MRNRFVRYVLVAVGFAAVSVAAVLIIDLLSPHQLMAEVVDVEARQGTTQLATVQWVDGGVIREASVNVPLEYDGYASVPIVVVPNGSLTITYVDDGWLSPSWYVIAALVGLVVGGPVAQGLLPRDYEEKPVRMTAWHVN